ncbi:hypothetical protein AKJ39_04760 [candidate division MSBL1 archaeon SCGC-AAA259J03]|uniref:Nickel transport protein n=1 Tax=candidate division MSBL1 archaeon SCGC-AAA259J03 TaxID=1698269 RepID=A0A656YUV3_9EURY|nr:hypothetical protein AKJ39_04760 [candidate division MSBL1 archaeon SCGC-AAA259J03]
MLTSLIILTVVPSVAYAHRVHTDWRYEEIRVEAWYGGGDAMRDADVKVYIVKERENELYETGKTNENGIFYFAPKVGADNYRVEVEASGGHKDSLEISLEKGSLERDKSMSLYLRIGAGFGYLLGLAGIAIGYLGWKKKKEPEMS